MNFETLSAMKELLGNGSLVLPLRIEGWHKSLTDGGWLIRNALGCTLMTVEFVEAEIDSRRPALDGNAPARTVVGLVNAVPALIAEVERQAGENRQLRAANLNLLIQEITERLTPEEAATFRGLILNATCDWVDEVTKKPQRTKRRLVN